MTAGESVLARVDFNLSDNTKMFVRYNLQRETQPFVIWLWWRNGDRQVPYPSSISAPNQSDSATVSLTHVFDPTLTSALTIALVLRSSGRVADGFSGTGEAARALLWYGVPRVPGEFALGALFTLPVTLAAHRAGAAQAGFVGLCISLLSMAGSLFAAA